MRSRRVHAARRPSVLVVVVVVVGRRIRIHTVTQTNKCIDTLTYADLYIFIFVWIVSFNSNWLLVIVEQAYVSS